MKLSRVGWLALLILLAPTKGDAITKDECANLVPATMTAVNGMDGMLEMLSKMSGMSDLASSFPSGLKESALAMEPPRINLINAIKQYKAALVTFGGQALKCATR